jgi:preprotein translocase subunit SecG
MESLAQGIIVMILIAAAIGGGIGTGIGWGVSKIFKKSKVWTMTIGGVAGLLLGFFSLPLISWLGYSLFG